MSRRFTPGVVLPLAALVLTPLGFAQNKDASGFTPLSSNLDTQLVDWQSEFGSEWHLRTNRRTGTMAMLFGGKADAGFKPNINNDNDWFELTRFWLNQTFAMHGVYGQDLTNERVVFLPLAKSNTTDKMTVALKQQVNGIAVEDGKVNALFTLGGELLSLHSTSAPSLANRSAKPSMDAETATSRAMEAFAETEGVDPLYVGAPELMFAHVDDQETRRWALAWQIDVQNTETADKPVGNVYSVDAHTGAVLKSSSSVHFFDVNGTIFTKATPGLSADRAANPPVDMAMPYARVTSSAGTVTTDANGNFSYPGVNTPLDLTVEYFGDFANCNHDQGADHSETFTGVQPNQANTLVMNSNPTEYVTAQANAYVHVSHLRDWIRDLIPSDGTADFRATTNCNIDDSCNAFYNGSSTNYYNQAGSCNNTAFSAVVAHEMGHWLNVLYGTGNGSDGMGEGNADVFALYSYDDPINGRFFFTSGGFVRTGNNTRQYCGDGNGGCHGGVHASGEVWMGAAWKIRERLNASLGNTQGDLTANLLFLSWMNSYNQTEIDSIIELQWLTLDDDNGNVNDGTPNYLDIDGGFEQQGFPGFDLSFVTFSNEVPIEDTRDEDGPYVAQIDMDAVFNPPVASGSLFYRLGNSGAFTEVAMAQGTGDTWLAGIPGFVSPATIQYYYRGTDSTGGFNEYPQGGATAPNSFRVGTVVEFLFNDFEGATDEGWTGGVAGDDATTGVWTRGNPVGTSAQPEDDHTAAGSSCWFTGNAGAGSSVGTNDVDGGITTLLSPVFDAEGLANAQVSYWRWYSNDEGSQPSSDTFLVQLSGDGGSTWSNVEIVGPTIQASGGWLQHTFTIDNIMTPTNNMRLRFEASDLGGGSIVEAAIDDIQGFSHDASDAPLGTRYCTPGTNNSTGGPATLGAFGSPNVSDNDVLLIATGMPGNVFGFFLNGTQEGLITMPGGSQGNLCVAGQVGRYNFLPEIFNTGLFGVGELQLDLNDSPSPFGRIQILSGETWSFQCWYRDSAASSSNFTDAITINF